VTNAKLQLQVTNNKQAFHAKDNVLFDALTCRDDLLINYQHLFVCETEKDLIAFFTPMCFRFIVLLYPTYERNNSQYEFVLCILVTFM
jgi:hypothetical protein